MYFYIRILDLPSKFSILDFEAWNLFWGQMISDAGSDKWTKHFTLKACKRSWIPLRLALDLFSAYKLSPRLSENISLDSWKILSLPKSQSPWGKTKAVWLPKLIIQQLTDISSVFFQKFLLSIINFLIWILQIEESKITKNHWKRPDSYGIFER